MRNVTVQGVAVGAGGMLVLVAVLVVVLLPLYSDYTGRARTGNMLNRLKSVKEAVEVEAGRSGSLEDLGSKVLLSASVVPSNEVDYVRILSSGEIVGRAAGGSVVVLIPSLSGSGIIWKCLGGPPKDMPVDCR